MADSIQIPIQIITKEALDQIKRFSRNTESSLKGINSSTNKISNSFNSVRRSLNNVSNVATSLGGILITAFAGRALLNGIDNLVEKATQFENSLIGVRSVAANFGVTATDITKTVESLAADGLVPVQDVANSLKNLLATGLNLEQSTKLFLTLKDAAAFGRQGFLDLGQAIEGATQGIKNGQSTLVDNAGITKNLSVLQKEYAARIGTTVGKLTEAQKREAIYQGLLREGAIFAGDAARLQETYSGAVSKLNFSFTKLQVRLGQFVTRSPAVAKVISILADRFVLLTNFVDKNESSISEFIKNLSISFVNGVIKIIDVVDLWERGFRIIPIFFGKAIIDAKIILLESLDTMIEGINYFRNLVGADPLKKYTDSVLELGKASELAADDINKIVIEQTTLQSVSENLQKVSESLNDIEPTANLDKLNKQIKKTSDVSNEAKNGIEKLSDDSIKFLERYSSKASEIFTKISGVIAKEGISINNALSFAFGGGKEDLLRQLDEREKILNKAKDKGEIGEVEFELRKKDLDQNRKDLERNANVALATGFTNALASGSQGASKFTTAFTSFFANKLLPGVGTALGPLFDLFAQGPEATKKALDGFAESLPIVIENVIKSIPVAIQAVADNVDIIILRLVDRSDEIVIALVTGLIRALPQLSIAFTKALIYDLNVGLLKLGQEFAQKVGEGIVKFIFKGLADIGTFLFEGGKQLFNGFFEAIKSIGTFFYDLGKSIFTGLFDALGSGFSILSNLFKSIFGFDGGGTGPVEDFLGFDFPFIAFAKGGMVPGNALLSGDSAKNDTVPALLSPGEMVIPRTVVNGGPKSIAKFLDKMGIKMPGFFIGGIIDSIKEEFESAVGSVTNIFKDPVGAITNLVTDPFGIGSKLITVGNKVGGDRFNNFVDKLVGNIPLDPIVGPSVKAAIFALKFAEILESLKNIGVFLDVFDILRDPTNIIGNAVKGVKDFFQPQFRNLLSTPFANGGLVPSGFPNDSFPARLTSGELVVDRSTTADLQEFLTSQSNQNASNATIESLLAQLVGLMRSDQKISTTVEFRDDVLADIILNLSRNNARLA
jgi:hypothetical protein